MTVAATAAYASVRLLGLPEGFPAAITAIIVTQGNLGGSLKTAAEQIIGSVVGATLAAAVVLTVQPIDLYASIATVAFVLAPLTLLTARSPGYRVAPIAALLVLVGDLSLQFSPFDLAGQRILGAGFGCAVGLLVSILVVPARATRSAIEISSRISQLMADQLLALSGGGPACPDTLAKKARETRENLARLALLAEEAARERKARLSGAVDSHRILRTLRRLRQDIDMLRRAARDGGNDAVHECAVASWRHAAEGPALTLKGISKLLIGEPASVDFSIVANSLRDYRRAVEDMRRSEITRSLSTSELSRLFGIGFALDQLRHDLADFIEVTKEVA